MWGDGGWLENESDHVNLSIKKINIIDEIRIKGVLHLLPKISMFCDSISK